MHSQLVFQLGERKVCVVKANYSCLTRTSILYNDIIIFNFVLKFYFSYDISWWKFSRTFYANCSLDLNTDANFPH